MAHARIPWIPQTDFSLDCVFRHKIIPFLLGVIVTLNLFGRGLTLHLDHGRMVCPTEGVAQRKLHMHGKYHIISGPCPWLAAGDLVNFSDHRRKSDVVWTKIYSQKPKTITNSANNDEAFGIENESFGEREQKLTGILVLLTVPLSWGTFAPCVKYIYALDPPVPGFVFSSGYYGIAAVALLGLNAIMTMKERQVYVARNSESQQQITQNDNADFTNETKKNGLTKGDLPTFAIGGLELGFYLFLGNCLQVIGLQSVPADRAAFLVQLTTIMVPLLSAFFARDLSSISRKTWIACCIAFAGVVTMELDGQEEEKVALLSNLSSTTSFIDTTISWSGILNNLPSLGFGDSLIVLAAVTYSLHVIRLEKYANRLQPLTLAASKATVEFTLSSLTVLGLLAVGPTANSFSKEIFDFFQVWGNAESSSSTLTSGQIFPAVGAVLWTGLVTCAYTIYAQSFGQRTVKPTEANLIYGCQPIFSAVFACLLLGEKLGWPGFVGGTLIISAILLVSYTPYQTEPLQEQNE